MTTKTLLEQIDELIPHLQFGALHGSFHNAEIARKTNQGMAAQLLSDLRPRVAEADNVLLQALKIIAGEQQSCASFASDKDIARDALTMYRHRIAK